MEGPAGMTNNPKNSVDSVLSVATGEVNRCVMTHRASVVIASERRERGNLSPETSEIASSETPRNDRVRCEIGIRRLL